jgi:tetratricopeptide (TPR) repeat protein
MVGGHCKTLQDYNRLYHNCCQDWSLTLCLVTIICLSLLPAVFVQAKEGDDSTLYNTGLALDKSGSYTGAILYFDKALAIQPNNTYLLDLRGIALNNLGNYTGAIQYFDKALATKDETALYNKGNSFHHLGFPTW